MFNLSLCLTLFFKAGRGEDKKKQRLEELAKELRDLGLAEGKAHGQEGTAISWPCTWLYASEVGDV